MCNGDEKKMKNEMDTENHGHGFSYYARRFPFNKLQSTLITP